MTSAAGAPIPVFCFGEILWDFLPDGLFPGGAPFNVAYHLKQHGLTARPVSAVGRDVLGDELCRRMRSWGVSDDTIARAGDRPTGYVRATVSPSGDASYDIVPDVAWDRIQLTEAARVHAPGARAVVYGSLAQRSEPNRATLQELFELLPGEAWRVFDVNLRPPHDDLDLVHTLAGTATVLKLNSAEARRLLGLPAQGDESDEAQARQLAEKTGCRTVCLTAGARGAGLLRNDLWFWEDGRPVQVADTVGAGDAFLAGLLAHLLEGRLDDRECLRRACRLGEWVATCRGATPPYSNNADK